MNGILGALAGMGPPGDRQHAKGLPPNYWLMAVAGAVLGPATYLLGKRLAEKHMIDNTKKFHELFPLPPPRVNKRGHHEWMAMYEAMRDLFIALRDTAERYRTDMHAALDTATALRREREELRGQIDGLKNQLREQSNAHQRLLEEHEISGALIGEAAKVENILRDNIRTLTKTIRKLAVKAL